MALRSLWAKLTGKPIPEEAEKALPDDAPAASPPAESHPAATSPAPLETRSPPPEPELPAPPALPEHVPAPPAPAHTRSDPQPAPDGEQGPVPASVPPAHSVPPADATPRPATTVPAAEAYPRASAAPSQPMPSALGQEPPPPSTLDRSPLVAPAEIPPAPMLDLPVPRPFTPSPTSLQPPVSQPAQPQPQPPEALPAPAEPAPPAEPGREPPAPAPVPATPVPPQPVPPAQPVPPQPVPPQPGPSQPVPPAWQPVPQERPAQPAHTPAPPPAEIPAPAGPRPANLPQEVPPPVPQPLTPPVQPDITPPAPPPVIPTQALATPASPVPASPTPPSAIWTTAGSTPAAAPVVEEARTGWFGRLKQGLSRSTGRLTDGLTGLFTKRKLDDEALEELEEALITADLGVSAAGRIVENFRKSRFGKEVTDQEVKEALAAEIGAILAPVAKPLEIDTSRKPHVVLVVGVNGTGKTTTIAKLGQQWSEAGQKVTFVAGDTFRAAAVEQLQIWGSRTGCDVVAPAKQGADAAGLAFDALKQAQERQTDILLVDTAGRLHNKSALMEELRKVVRVMQRVDPTAPHSVLLVLDATTGQNATQQCKVFAEMVNVTGLVVTKLDGSAKGGIVVALAQEFGLPVHAVGVGEKAADLRPFSARDFSRSLLGLD